MTRPRLVVVGRGEPERGGIPTFLAMLADAGPQLGYDVHLVNLTPGHRTRGGHTSAANVARTVADAARVLRAVRPGDVVHVHSALAPTATALRAGVLLFAARARRAHGVVHAHGGLLAVRRGTPVRRLLLRLSLRPAALVVAVSAGVRAALTDAGVPPERVRLLRNGVATDRFCPGADHDHEVPRVLFVGGLTPRKGVLDLAAASSRLVAEGVDHELWLVGGVPDEGTAVGDDVLRSLPPHAQVRGPTAPEEMPALYAQVDVFCLPSWWEAMPLTVLEAQSAGLPVVATDVGDVAAMVVDGVTGLIVPPRDPAALGSALRAVLASREVRAAMGTRARTHAVADCDVTMVVRRLAGMLDEARGVA